MKLLREVLVLTLRMEERSDAELDVRDIREEPGRAGGRGGEDG